MHDSTIFENSRVRAILETGHVKGCLVGDDGYGCRPYLLIPVTNPNTATQKAYNELQILARNCIERINGMLKRKFPALKNGLRINIKHTLPVTGSYRRTAQHRHHNGRRGARR